MGILYGFAPWIVYWILVGNVPFTAAVLVGLAVAVATFVTSRAKGAPGKTLQIGALGTFAVLTVLTFTLETSFTERWIQPLSNAGIFAVTLVGVLIGKPFVREFAEAGHPSQVLTSDLFQQMTVRLTWLWVAVFAGMTISSAIPPIVEGQATILDTKTTLSVVFYWLIPFVLLSIGALATHVLPEKMLAGINDLVRKTTFVAYSEATIDELYYLAREHAGREVGGGQQAYDIKVGGSGTPLVGDESRLSWPSTYRVRSLT